jgi:hypothetical protein
MPNSPGEVAKARGLVVNFFILEWGLTKYDWGDFVDRIIVNNAFLRGGIPCRHRTLIDSANDVAGR